VVFRRRDKLSTWAWLREGVWPQAGWRRVIEYTKHRLRRLPDTPEKIGRGMWCGIFASFTPLFGLHFLLAFALARLLRGNVLAALIGTFAINPLTIVPVGISAMVTGKFLLGRTHDEAIFAALPEAFSAAGRDLWTNFGALFGRGEADWTGLIAFWDAIFLPYLIGGIIPGAITATAFYLVTVQITRAHQARRRKRLGNQLSTLQKNQAAPPDPGGPAG
jgi:uncharacterized protein (DUF2062 family)